MLDVDVITIVYDSQNTIIDSSGVSVGMMMLFKGEKVGNVNNALMHLGFTFLTTRYHEGLGASATHRSIYIREKKNTL